MSGAESPAHRRCARAWRACARLLPRWAWILIFLGLASRTRTSSPTLLGGLRATTCSTHRSTPSGYMIMALGLNIVVGFAGLLDLGYVAFYAIGAFVDRLARRRGSSPDVRRSTSSTRRRRRRCPGIHINFVIVVIIAAAFTAFWGVILGAPTLRLRGDYLAIVTLAFGEIVPRVFENSTSGTSDRLTTSPTAARASPRSTSVYFPGVGELNYPLELDRHLLRRPGDGPRTLFINMRLRDSRLGRAWIAVREDEVAAAAMGVNLVRTKLWAYAIGAALRRLRRRVPRRLPEHRQRRPVRVRLLGLHPLHGHHRRHGQHLGRHARRDRAVDARPLHPAPAQQRPRPSGSTST